MIGHGKRGNIRMRVAMVRMHMMLMGRDCYWSCRSSRSVRGRVRQPKLDGVPPAPRSISLIMNACSPSSMCCVSKEEERERHAALYPPHKFQWRWPSVVVVSMLEHSLQAPPPLEH